MKLTKLVAIIAAVALTLAAGLVIYLLSNKSQKTSSQVKTMCDMVNTANVSAEQKDAEARELSLLQSVFNCISVQPYEYPLDAPVRQRMPGRVKVRLVGSLVGLAVGDAVGVYYESKMREYVLNNLPVDMKNGGIHNLKAGQWTDVTSLALCLASSLLVRGHCNTYDQLHRYIAWYEKGYLSSTDRCFSIEANMKEALDRFSTWQDTRGAELAKEHFSPQHPNIEEAKYVFADLVHRIFEQKAWIETFFSPGSCANGSLMRLAPISIFYHNNPELAIKYAAISSMTTHDAPVAVDSCKFYAALICAAANGASKDDLLHEDFYTKYDGTKDICLAIREIAEGSYKTDKPPADVIKDVLNGDAPISLKGALWAFYNDGGSFKKGVELAISLGGHTNAMAAIYGQLAGAFYGYSSIPEEWHDKLFAHDFIVEVASYLSERTHKND